jgi:hypothetical protein
MFHGAPSARSNLSDWDGSDRTLLGYGAMTGDARLGPSKDSRLSWKRLPLIVLDKPRPVLFVGREYGTTSEASAARLQDSGSDGGSRAGDDIVMPTTVTALLIVYNVELQRIGSQGHR